MSKHYTRPYEHSRVRGSAQSHGTWGHLSRKMVSVARETTPEGDLFHDGGSPHRRSRALTVSREPLRNLSGNWCACLTSKLVSPFRDQPPGFDSVDRITLSLALYDLFLQDTLAAFLQKPSVPSRRILQEALTPSGHESDLRTANIQVSWNNSSRISDRLRSSVEALRTGVLSQVESALSRPDLAADAQRPALRKLVSQTWLQHLTLDESLVLLGVHGSALVRLRSQSAPLIEVFGTHTVHSSKDQQVTLVRVPRYVADYVVRLSLIAPLAVQVVPWDLAEGMDFSELATLWAPDTTDALCDLARCIQTLRSV